MHSSEHCADKCPSYSAASVAGAAPATAAGGLRALPTTAAVACWALPPCWRAAAAPGWAHPPRRRALALLGLAGARRPAASTLLAGPTAAASSVRPHRLRAAPALAGWPLGWLHSGQATRRWHAGAGRAQAHARRLGHRARRLNAHAAQLQGKGVQARGVALKHGVVEDRGGPLPAAQDRAAGGHSAQQQNLAA